MKRDITMSFRITKEEHEKILKNIEKSGLNKSRFLATSAMNKKIVKVEGLTEISYELRKIGNNVNQIARLANMGKIETVYMKETREELKDTWQLLSLLTKGTNR